MISQVLRGTTEQNNVYTGLEGELTFDETKQTLRIHDGEIPGGYEFTAERAYVGSGFGIQRLQFGDLQLGYYGTITGEDGPSTADIQGLTGFNSGSVIRAIPSWMKFSYKGNVLFVPMRPLTNAVTWAQLYQAGLVYGVDGVGPYPYNTGVNQNKIIEWNGFRYRVRLFKGAENNPTTRGDTTNATGFLCEWNDLMYKVAASTNGPWASYSNNDLNVGTGAIGDVSWCQEGNGSNRVLRGSGSISGFYQRSYTDNAASRSWRPVLELIKG